jgi:hypothetical protein
LMAWDVPFRLAQVLFFFFFFFRWTSSTTLAVSIRAFQTLPHLVVLSWFSVGKSRSWILMPSIELIEFLPYMSPFGKWKVCHQKFRIRSTGYIRQTDGNGETWSRGSDQISHRSKQNATTVYFVHCESLKQHWRAKIATNKLINHSHCLQSTRWIIGTQSSNFTVQFTSLVDMLWLCNSPWFIIHNPKVYLSTLVRNTNNRGRRDQVNFI